MAQLTKRLRFEILRRDGHTCRYCGRKAPDVELAVDHVLPVALGGETVPQNLVAACRECNSGKSATSPDEVLVADVSTEALRWARARAIATEQMVQDAQDRDALLYDFEQAWGEWTYGSGEWMFPLPSDWKSSVSSFHTSGLPRGAIFEAVEIACSNRNVKPSAAFKYFCGVCFNKIRALDAATRKILEDEDGS